MMQIQVRYFASVREQLGAGGPVTLPDAESAPHTVGQLREWLAGQSPAHAVALDQTKGLRMAFNQTLCSADQALADGAEVAFFPPVTGG
jgi:molybdopterin synthase sulfur carrier subunit